MNEQGFLELLCHTTDEEKVKRFEEASRLFHDKYFSLVWYARSDENELLKKEIYEGLSRMREVEKEFPEEVKPNAAPSILICATGKIKTSGGFKWEYL